MSDTQRTCGDCAWYRDERICMAPTCIAVWEISMIDKDHEANECETFRSHSDQALVDECHKLRSLGAAVEWAKIDRLVEIAAGKELDGKKRCDFCGGNGVDGYEPNGDRVDCHICHGTGYKKGGDE